jgi:hypothetical protein
MILYTPPTGPISISILNPISLTKGGDPYLQQVVYCGVEIVLLILRFSFNVRPQLHVDDFLRVFV